MLKHSNLFVPHFFPLLTFFFNFPFNPVADLLSMPLSRDLQQTRAVAAGGGAATYAASTRKHHYLYDAAGGDDLGPSAKRRNSAASSWEDGWSWRLNTVPGRRTCVMSQLPVLHRDSTGLGAVSAHRQSEEGDTPVMSRDEIERCSPSRKDGIDRYMEARLRYSYCAYLQSLGMRLDLPQMTVGTAMVLCHRFFLRRSHASNDRFLIATAALFLAAKSEETPCLLNSVLSASCEICQKQNFAFFPHLLYAQDWFEQYRDRVVEAEQLILKTLNFELEVEHPYVPLTSVFKKLGLSQTVLLNLAWNLVNEGLRSSLWLQFKPHHIAAGSVFLAAKFLKYDLTLYQHIWQEFQTTAPVLEDVVQQLMELL
ncbi:cyclin-T1-5 isoform X1 [Dendrobium catenatum]|uniref:cyclin-T1-5 isoform X1 n=1 Tax=Dendrobium catenatum TaxID=906689 RepID=UPI0009F48C46|nr:cyclin-T1-5 isoform X1 [Dendrobium catenatum]